MKEYLKIAFNRGVDSSPWCELPEEIFDKLAHQFPSGITASGSFLVTLEVGGPELRELLSFLGSEAGRKPQSSLGPRDMFQKKGIFRVRGERLFDIAELNQARFCLLRPQKDMGSNSYDAEGRVFYERAWLVPHRMATGGVCEIFCGNEMAEKILAQKFNNVQFRQVLVVGRGKPKACEPIWQLWTDMVLPPMLNEIFDSDGRRLAAGEDSRRGSFVNDIFYPRQIRYPEAVLPELGDADLVRSVEGFGANVDGLKRPPYLFASRRLRDWLKLEKISMDLSPVIFES